MKRVLFVDDEPNVLAGLRALLRPLRKEWEMEFAPGGEEGIEALGSGRFDVVVTDMKMPGTDGAAVLRHAQQHHPGVIRMVLSGHAELETALRIVPVAHQFLLKPCDPQVLETAVRRACDLQVLVNDPVVRGLVGGVGSLPVLPEVYVALTRLLQNENATMGEIAERVEGDAAMCAKLLQLVNSAFIGLGREIGNVDQAISYMGINLLKNLTLVVHVFDSAAMDRAQALWLHHMQRHGLLVGAIARRVVGNDPRIGDDAFMAGILHDVGKLVLMKVEPDAFAECQAQARSERRPTYEVERERFGVSHAEVGGYLLGIWGLPYPIVEAVANHHAPGRVTQPCPDVLTAVYVGNLLVHEQEGRMAAADDPAPQPDERYLEQAGALEHLPEWREFAAGQVGSNRAGAWGRGKTAEAA